MATIPSESPNILVKEIDLTGQVPGVTSSTGAFVGKFNWGPVNTPILVGNEAALVENFGSPYVNDSAGSRDFLTAAYFLKYSGSLYVVRGGDSDTMKNAGDTANVASFIPNRNDWEAGEPAAASDFFAKYPGPLGNSIAVKVCNGLDNFNTFNALVDSSFDAAPGTSPGVSLAGGSNDELHLAVVDSDGLISGERGTILETFAFLSGATDAKKSDGGSNYAKTVVNAQSEYIWLKNLSDKTGFGTASAGYTGAAADSTTNTQLEGGTFGQFNAAEYLDGASQFNDADTIQVDFLIAPGLDSSTDAATVTNNLIAIAEGPARRDCVVVASPAYDDVVGIKPVNATANVVATANSYTFSNYLAVDNNWLKVYDKYKDEYTNIPASSSTAGLMASTDLVADPWFSPAGQRRGRYLGVTSLAYNADRTQRDTLYKASVNPISNIPGQGVLLYGDKTHQNRPSAFDRINVRRLFLVLERAIKAASQNVLFELNDEFTRAEFVNVVEPFLREVKGRRGVTDFRVVCDETNNTPSVIDSNRFVASIFIKPARSINYVTLNFVAVRSGVEFEEITGVV
jgi:phage tail sheath protein FI